jgi:hypothetical protein
MKMPRFFSWDDVPRQIVSSAMVQALSDRFRITSVVAAGSSVAASLCEARNFDPLALPRSRRPQGGGYKR